MASNDFLKGPSQVRERDRFAVECKKWAEKFGGS